MGHFDLETVMGTLMDEERVLTMGAKVGRPCSSKLLTSQKGLMRDVAMTLALPVWA